MTSSAELKLRARKTMLGNYGFSVGIQMLINVISSCLLLVVYFILVIGIVALALGLFAGDSTMSAASSITLTVVIFLVVYLLIYMLIMMWSYLAMFGQTRIYMNLCVERKAKVADLFSAFKNRFGKMMRIVMLLVLISIVLMIPSFAVSFAAGYSGDDMFSITFSLLYSIVLIALAVFVELNFGMFLYILLDDPDKGLFQALSESRQMMMGNRGRLFYLNLSLLGWMLLGIMTFGVGYLWLNPFLSSTRIHFYLDLKPQIEVYPPQWQIDREGMQMEQWQMDSEEERMNPESVQTDL